MSKIAVDVTPLLPGGINGGAKPMVLALLQELPRLLPQDEFILWTADYSHDELAFLDRTNLKRICIHFSGTKEPEKNVLGFKWFVKKGWELAKRWLPERIQYRLRAFYYQNKITPMASASLHKDEKADFLFSPFGAPTYYNPNIPTLSIVYDLQFLDHPEFFTEQERFYRRLHFDQICKLADHVVTISEFTRQSVLKNSNIPPEQVTTIHIGLLHEPSTGSAPDEVRSVLARLGLEPQRYLFYPANFWAHKNHGALLQGFQLFRQNHLESGLKIVFTGALDDRRIALFAQAKQMGLDQQIVAPGFLPDHEIGTLYRNARGLIFPSLYEGFGIPLLEAMQAGIPVACSHVTSLPEIGGDAVLYFNPQSAHEISRAIEALEFNDLLRNELIQKGSERLQVFGDAGAMTQKYADLICHMLGSKKKIHSYGLHGLTEDRWFQGNAYLMVPNSPQKRFMEFTVQVPEWMPSGLELTITESDNRLADYQCDRGNRLDGSLALPASEGIVEMRFSASHTPASLGVANDHRPLSAECLYFQIKSPEGTLLFDAFDNNPNHQNL